MRSATAGGSRTNARFNTVIAAFAPALRLRAGVRLITPAPTRWGLCRDVRAIVRSFLTGAIRRRWHS